MRPGRTLTICIAAAALASCLFLPEQAVENRGRTPLEIESTNIEDASTGIALNASIEAAR